MEKAPGGRSVGGSPSDEPDWDAIIADLAIATGWTWDHILDTVTMSRLTALRSVPYLHRMVAAALGAEPSKPTPTADFGDFIANIPQTRSP